MEESQRIQILRQLVKDSQSYIDNYVTRFIRDKSSYDYKLKGFFNHDRIKNSLPYIYLGIKSNKDKEFLEPYEQGIGKRFKEINAEYPDAWIGYLTEEELLCYVDFLNRVTYSQLKCRRSYTTSDFTDRVKVQYKHRNKYTTRPKLERYIKVGKAMPMSELHDPQKINEAIAESILKTAGLYRGDGETDYYQEAIGDFCVREVPYGGHHVKAADLMDIATTIPEGNTKEGKIVGHIIGMVDGYPIREVKLSDGTRYYAAGDDIDTPISSSMEQKLLDGYVDDDDFTNED